MKRLLTVILVLVAAVAIAVVAVYAYGNRKAAEGRGLLPPPPPASQIKYAGSKSFHPYTPTSPGVLTRTIYRTTGSPDFNIEIRDVLVGPGKQLSAQTFRGTALVEVGAGEGAAGFRERKSQLRAGSRMLVPAQTPIRLSNPGAKPLLVHVYVIEGK